MHRPFLLPMLGCAALLAACGDGRTPPPDEASDPVTVRPVHWNYEGEEGPAHWVDLSPAYALCAEGPRQSPIDLVASRTDSGATLARAYESAAVTVTFNEQAVDLLDNGHTIQVTYDGGDTLTVEGVAYALRQFHLHAPSEHTVAGKRFPLEVHLVHQAQNGALAVLGVVVTPGIAHPTLANLIANLPAPGGDRHFDDRVLNVDALIPAEERYYRYDGSLTTPPCSEGVRWFVMATPLEASPAQLDTLAAVLGTNNRPLQPRGDREVLLIAR